MFLPTLTVVNIAIVQKHAILFSTSSAQFSTIYFSFLLQTFSGSLLTLLSYRKTLYSLNKDPEKPQRQFYLPGLEW